LVGALLSGWFMVTAAHLVRMEFVACMALLPYATNGLYWVWSQRTWGQVVPSARLWKATLAAIWLLPFLAAASASTERLSQWHARSKVVSDYLARKTTPGDRVWASPPTYRSIVLGKIPLFGFLAHDWPLYFGAPRAEAESYADSYTKIYRAPSADSALAELVRTDVDWIIIDGLEQHLPPWYPPRIQGIITDTTLNSYTLLRVRPNP